MKLGAFGYFIMSSCSQCKILQQITLLLGLFTEQYSETSCGVVFFLNYIK